MDRTSHRALFVATSLLLVLALLGGGYARLTRVGAQDPTPHDLAGPGWRLAEAEPVSPQEARKAEYGRRIITGASDEAEVTPEIAALAHGLDDDPRLILDYVHNHIDYVPTYGLAKGATATMRAGRGNDWDQAALLVALLRAAGYSARYVIGDVVYDLARLSNWTGVEPAAVGNVFASGGVPIAGAAGGYEITRVWVEVEIAGQSYLMDPAMKTYTQTECIDLAAATGYDRNALIAQALSGATLDPGGDWVQALNEPNVRSTLDGYAANLIDYIQTHLPTAGVGQVVGSRQIVAKEMGAYATSLPYALSSTPQGSYDALPAAYQHTIQVQHQGIDHTFAAYQIAGKRVSIFYDSGNGNRPILRVDGAQVAQGTPTTLDASYPMTVTVDHPYASPSLGDQYGVFALRSGGAYALIHDLEGVSEDLIAARKRVLDGYALDGLSGDTEAALGESLWLMGLEWLAEVDLYDHLVDRIGGVLTLQHHTVGILGQQEGYFIDVPMGMNSIVARDGTADTWPAFRLQTVMGSAFEHGVLEQTQGAGRPAVSAVKLLQMNNAGATEKTFYVDSANWSAIEPQLQGYSASTKAHIAAGVAAGYEYILPQEGDQTLNQWHGLGFVQHYQSGSSGSIGMIISGGYYGGYVSVPGAVISSTVAGHVDLAYPPPDERTEISTPLSTDPVDMSSGAFVYAQADIPSRVEEPLGLRFERAYSSGGSESQGVLGYGWSHNYQIALHTHSTGAAGLGRRLPVDAAPAIVAVYAGLDLLGNQLDVQGWTTTLVSCKWAMDLLSDNALTVRGGPNSATYVLLPDGSYHGPRGGAPALVREGDSTFQQTAEGGALLFDAQGKLRAWQDGHGSLLSLAYDAGDLLQTVTSSLGMTLSLTYSGGLLSSVTDQAGREATFGYVNGRLETATDVEGQTWNYGYDAAQRLASITRPRGNVIVTNIYDEWGRVVTQTDALGNAATFGYSPYRSAVTAPNGGRTLYTFDDQGRMLTREDALGGEIAFAYDGLGQMTSIADRLGDTTAFTYHAPSGRLASLTDARGQSITYTYAARSMACTNPITPVETAALTVYDLTQVAYPDGTAEEMSYDGAGSLAAYTDQGDALWEYTYNAAGQVTLIQGPAGETITYTYLSNGALGSSQDADGVLTTYEYDAALRPITLTYAGGIEAVLGYDRLDRITSLTDERGSTLQARYDANGNLVEVIDQAGQSTTYSYDPMDRPVRRTDREGGVTITAYDSSGRIESVTDPNGGLTQYAYDARGWLDEVTDPASKTWEVEFDAEGVPAARTSPLGASTVYTTDALGALAAIANPLRAATQIGRDEMMRLTSIAAPSGGTHLYGYDDRGRLATASGSGLGTARYEHDGRGLITQIVIPNGTWKWSYTKAGRVESETDPLNNAWHYHYDSRGRLDQITYPGGATQQILRDDAGNVTRRLFSDSTDLAFSYDAANRLVSAAGVDLTLDAEGRITDTQSAGVSFEAAYDPGGRLTEVGYAGGLLTVRYQWDARDLLTRVSDNLTGAEVTFTYDDDGRLTGIERSNGVDTDLTWDAASRLTGIQIVSATIPLADLQYTYDPDGRVTAASVQAPLNPADALDAMDEGWTVDAASQISAAGYTYDARGRVTALPRASLTWDDASRLTGVTPDGGPAQALTYNGLGSLETRGDGASATRYYRNYALGLMPVVAEQQVSPSTAWQRFYVWTPRGHLLYAIEAAGGNQVRFYHHDKSGSTLMLTDAQGDVTDAYAYSPYGRLLAQQGSSEQPYTYLGKHGVRQDEAVESLYHTAARTYDAVTARFVRRDDAWPNLWRPEAMSPYQYAHGDPVSHLDVTGLYTEIDVRIAFSEKYVDPLSIMWLDMLIQRREDLRQALEEHGERWGWSEQETQDLIDQELDSASFDLSGFQKGMMLFPGDPLELHAVLINREAPGKFVGPVQWWLVLWNGERRLIGQGDHLRLSPDEMQRLMDQMSRSGDFFRIEAVGTYQDAYGADEFVQDITISVAPSMTRAEYEEWHPNPYGTRYQ